MIIWPFVDDFAKQEGFMFGSLNMDDAIFRQEMELKMISGGRKVLGGSG